MRTVSPTTAGLLAGADRHGIVESDLVVFIVKEWDGTPSIYAFWTEHDTETVTVTSPWTGLPQSYDFVGGGTILEVGETPRTSDLSIRRKSVTLSNIHPAVADMWAKDMRLAQIAVFQAIYDPESRNMVEALLEFVGELNGAPKEVPAAGGQGGIKFDFVSDTRQGTRVNHAKKSHEHQMRRSGDGFHKHIGVAGNWTIPFGQDGATGGPNSPASVGQILYDGFRRR